MCPAFQAMVQRQRNTSNVSAAFIVLHIVAPLFREKSTRETCFPMKNGFNLRNCITLYNTKHTS